MLYISNSEKETKKIGFELGLQAKPGDIYCLSGDLGVGKTVFTKGFAEGLGISDYVTSPTFTIINEYQGRMALYHFDVYRITDIEEMDDTGYEDYFFGNGVCLIEWAEMIQELIPESASWITIQKNYSKDENYREIKIEKKEKGKNRK